MNIMIKLRNYLFMLVFLLALIATVQAEPIKLYNITVQVNGTWQFGESYKIIVLTHNMSGSLVDVTDVGIELKEDMVHSQTPVVRTDVGIYSRSYIINETNFTTAHFMISVSDRGKTVTNEIEIKFEERSNLQKFFAKVTVYWKNMIDMISKRIGDYWLQAIIVVFTSLTIIVFIDLFLRKRKKE